MNAMQPQPHERRRPSRAQRLVEEVCDYFSVDEQVLRARTRGCGCRLTRNSCACGRSPRSRAYVEARMLVMYLLDRDLLVPRTRIGALLEREHSTVAYNVRRADALLASRRDLRWHLEQLRTLLREKGVLRG